MRELNAADLAEIEQLAERDAGEHCRGPVLALVVEVRRLRRKGFEVWGAPGSNPGNVKRWRKGLLAHGGKGIILTTWTKCDCAHRKKLLETVRQCGALL